MAPRRRSTALRDLLPSALLPAFDAQAAALRAYAGDLAQPDAVERLRAAMLQVWTQSFGLEPVLASALTQLAVVLPPASAVIPRGDAVLERAALQRALVVVGWAAALAPFVAAAARGAVAGMTIEDGDVLMSDPEAIAAAARAAAAALEAYIPTLQVAPTVDLSRVGIGTSPVFTAPQT